jgi:Na+/proline symporter
MTQVVLTAYILFIIIYSIYRSAGLQLLDFLYNARATPATSIFPSVVAGNIGAGTLYGLYSFGSHQPLLGLSIAVSYAIGLALAGLLARVVRKACEEITEFSLVGFIAQRHGVSDQKKWILWLAIGAVFILQLAVELIAVGDVISHVFAVGRPTGILFAAAVVASYIVVGGYRSTTVSAHLQAPLVVGTLLVVGLGVLNNLADSATLAALEARLRDSDFLRPIGAFVLITPAVFLSVDNWHRIVTAESDRAAMFGFVLGSIVCGTLYIIVVLAGAISNANAAPIVGLAAMMPAAIAWVAPLAIVVAIFSVMDTAIPPLVAGMPGSNQSLFRARVYTVALFACITMIALLLGNIVQGIIAAFSSLAVFFPATVSALLRRTTSTSPVLFGIPISVIAAIIMTHFFGEYALATSVLFSFTLYAILTLIDRVAQRSG